MTWFRGMLAIGVILLVALTAAALRLDALSLVAQSQTEPPPDPKPQTLNPSPPGDFNETGGIDSDDLFDFAYYFGLNRGEALYENEGYRGDFDQNGRIDELDLFYFSSHWHKK